MKTFFGPDFFTRNRDKLRERLGSDMPIVITGNGAIQRSSDEAMPFHQDSNFWYLTGLNGVDLTLVMTAQETYIIVPTLSFVREAFDGAHDREEYATRSGITTFVDETEGWKRLKAELQKAESVATLASPPAYLKFHGLHTLPYRRRLITKLKRMRPGIEIRDIRTELATMRCIKQPEELKAIQKAIDITGETLADIVASGTLTKVRNEYEIDAAIGYGFRTRGAEGHGFAPIVAAGKHSTTLHHMDNDGPIRDNDLIVLDVGASVEHYPADISRTVSKQLITGREADIFHAVASAQEYALNLLKPGVMLKEYEGQVETFIGKELVKLGVITDPTSENIRRHFPHATSHFLGLDTHDVGDYRVPLAAGMVITCEPGIYVPKEGIGVRLEDDILITETGYQLLSNACPRELTPVK